MDDEDRIEPERPEDEVAALLDAAGPRPRLPEDEVAPIRAAAREAFQRQARRTARRRRLVWAVGGSLAASLLVTIGLTLRPLRPSAAPGAGRPVATVELTGGDVAVLDAEGRPAASRTVLSGAVLRTGGSGRAAVRLPGGTSVRIDAGSAVRLDSPRLVSLERGAVYVDAGPAGRPGQEVEIATPLGSVRHVGTQFETRLLPRSGPGGPALRVRVREGAVLVEQADETLQVRAGGELLLEAGSRPERAEISVHGPGWDWIQRTAPPFEIEGARLVDFLDWASREAGLPWRLAGPRAGSTPEDVILHGSIEGLTAEEALAVVLPSSGYRHRRAGDEIVIERASP